jgi:hypothetical protein
MATVTKPIALDESLNTTETPSRNVADVLAEELQNIASAIGGGGSGGHTIEGADGTALSQEPTLQFADADATDDAVNEKTVVNVVRKRTQAQYDAMSAADKAKGIIHVTDANAKPLFASQVRYGAGTVNDIDSRVRNNITSRLANLPQAVAEQDLGKYGYKIGDYFVGSSGYEYILADMDTFYGGFDSICTLATHHIGIVVNTKNNGRVWNNGGSIPSDGYSASTLHTFLTGSCLVNIKDDLTALFADWSAHLLAHTKIFNKISGWVVSSSQVISALTECQVYGCPIFSGDQYQQGEATKQLAVFAKYTYMDIFGQYTPWLRSIANSSEACCASNEGYSAKNATSVTNLAAGLILFK